MNSDSSRGFVNLPIGFIEQLGDATSLPELLQVTSEWLDDVIDVDRASFTLTSEEPTERDVLTLFSIGKRTVVPDQTTFAIEGSATGKAFRERKVLNVADLAAAGFTDTDRLSSAGLGSALVVPLVNAGRVFGTANVARFAGGSFSDDDVRNVRAVASLIASYIWAHRRREMEYRAARIDELTGLLNRRAILEILGERMNEPHMKPVVLFLDLDGFKAINDAHGHAAGDALLVEVSKRLDSVSREHDLVGRIGGDEFLIICAPGTTAAGVEVFADRLIDVCSTPIEIGAARLTPRLSIGVAASHRDDRSTVDLLAEADHAMYEAKRSNRSIVVTDDRIRARADLIAAIDRDLPGAMVDDQLEFFLQPIIALDDDSIIGAEALLRWEHPEFGFVPPPLLLERIEATGQIEAFTRWSLDRIAADWSALQSEIPALESAAVSMNLNPSQLGLRCYAEWHTETLDRHDLDPSDILIEVVESGQIEVDAQSEKTLRSLAASGVTIALDDFGTGYNALGYFTRFPIHVVKFDRSLVSAMATSSEVRTIVEGLVAICAELGILSLAEGAETSDEVDLARQLGMDRAQGYVIGMPMPLSEFRQLPSLHPRGVQLSGDVESVA